ncbi:MAG: hypothetical protein HOV77_32455 [Hamadaea sp.]|uniref:hypothetical protein n=1 Tax=Hamadaea sp. TaxID=2024425 RepID=UPI0017F49714|nr:hypothetical protein [Hamadaea sp.]NUT23900.1 hypothetical protein [Hamadaea sp.]
MFSSPLAGAILGVLASAFFISIGVAFLQWAKKIRQMSPEERRSNPRNEGILGVSAVGFSLRHPWFAVAQAYFAFALAGLVLMLTAISTIQAVA